ncbi:MAG: hypothetical protein ABI639_01855 [Thermoanaerobaculia bacterium]
MGELGGAGRRLIVAAGALAAGALAAVLPALLGEPIVEFESLRGLAASTVALLAALVLVARWGARGEDSATSHALRLIDLLAVVSALLLPALFAGMTLADARELGIVTQANVGWKEPVSVFVLVAIALVATYSLFRLKSAVRGEGLAGWSVVAAALLSSVILFALSVIRLLDIPTLSGVEKLEKWTLLAILTAIALAALTPRRTTILGMGAPTLVLAASLFCAGPLMTWNVHSYLNPDLDEIERVLLTTGDTDGTTFVGALDDRPDLYGIWSLPNVSATPRLEVVRPIGASINELVERVRHTWLGTATLEPKLEGQSRFNPGGLWLPPLDSSVEVRIRTFGWPGIAFRPGLRLGLPIYDWAVAPEGTFAVTSGFEEPSPLSQDSGPGRQPNPTATVRLWRRDGTYLTLLDNLPMAPRILELTQNALRLVVYGQASSQGGFGAACFAAQGPNSLGVTACDLRRMTCEPWTMRPDIGGRWIRAGKRLLLGGGPAVLLDSRTLETVATFPVFSGSSGDSDLFYQLTNGRVVRLSLLGKMPDWDSRLTGYDSAGRETKATSLGNVRMTRFAGELDDGTVAIAWRARYGYAQLPVFGWTLDSWNPSSGERRRLADDVGVFPSADSDASIIMTDRKHHLIVPAAGGVRTLATLRQP